MMTDLTPDERRALQDAIDRHDGTAAEECIAEAIWRAARAYQAEQDALICDKFFEDWPAMENDADACADAIRERAKGLT